MVIAGIDPDPANNEKMTDWARDYWNALHPYSAGGAYVNFMMEEGVDRIQATYRDNYERLAAIKAKYDPENLFRVNQNIKPQGRMRALYSRHRTAREIAEHGNIARADKHDTPTSTRRRRHCRIQAALAGRADPARADDAYEEARKVWNGLIDKHPALIARCAGAADVIAAVNFANEHDLLLSVRGGGHNVAGQAVCNDGLVIDLSPMRAVRVDPIAPDRAGAGRRDAGRHRPCRHSHSAWPSRSGWSPPPASAD